MNIAQELEKFVGRRYKRLEDIINDLKVFGYPTPTVGEDQSPIEGADHQLICSLNTNLTEGKDYQDFTLYYLKDRVNNYYITEVNPWGIV
jgi:hypothetical protein